MSRQGLSYAEAGRLGAQKTHENLRVKRAKIKQEYEKSPNACSYCGSCLSYDKRNNKFCSRSCAASVNNRGLSRNKKIPENKLICMCCGEEISGSGKKYCCLECSAKHRRDVYAEKLMNNEISTEYPSKSVKRYLIEKRGYKCEECYITKWRGEEAPLQVHHMDGDAKNNHPDNLQILCCNCHALTENFGAKNKGNGRNYRYN